MAVQSKLMEIIWFRALLFVFLMGLFPVFVTALLGSIQETMKGVYLTTISDSRKDDFSIRVGYFGLCAVSPGGTSCTPSNAKSAPQVMDDLGIKGVDDLVQIALTLQNRIILYVLVVAGLCYTLAVAATGIAYFSRKAGALTSKKRKLLVASSEMSLAFCLTALAFTFASALSITQLVNGLTWMSKLTGTTIEFNISKLMLALQWMAASVLLLISLGNYLLYGRDHLNRSAAANLAEGISSGKGKDSEGSSTMSSEGSAPTF